MSSNDNYRTVNTVISGSDLVSNLSGDDVKALEFAAALRQLPPLTAAAVDLTVEQLIQATIGTLLVDNTANDVVLNLGADTANRALELINLFGFQAANEVRVLRVVLSGFGAGHDVILKNDSATSAHVNVSGSNTLTIFDHTAVSTANYAGNAAGFQRIIVVKAINVGATTAEVDFQVLPASK